MMVVPEKSEKTTSLFNESDLQPSTPTAVGNIVEVVTNHSTEDKDDKSILRKVDWQILPIMFLVYFLQFLDKIILNVSNQRWLHDYIVTYDADFFCLVFQSYAITERPANGG